MPNQEKTIKGPATQQFVDIDEIRDGVVLLKNGGFRAVLMCGSRNLELESADGQEAIIAAYADFLNSFDWPIQIVIHSRRLDIGPYLKTLEDLLKVQQNELLKIQTSEYINFVKNFVSLSDIMTKRFYIVVPFDPVESKTENPLEKIGSFIGTKGDLATITPEKFEEYKNQLFQRVEHIILALTRFGIKASRLQTDELVELFYNIYNPEELEKKDLQLPGVTGANESAPDGGGNIKI